MFSSVGVAVAVGALVLVGSGVSVVAGVGLLVGWVVSVGGGVSCRAVAGWWAVNNKSDHKRQNAKIALIVSDLEPNCVKILSPKWRKTEFAISSLLRCK